MSMRRCRESFHMTRTPTEYSYFLITKRLMTKRMKWINGASESWHQVTTRSKPAIRLINAQKESNIVMANDIIYVFLLLVSKSITLMETRENVSQPNASFTFTLPMFNPKGMQAGRLNGPFITLFTSAYASLLGVEFNVSLKIRFNILAIFTVWRWKPGNNSYMPLYVSLLSTCASIVSEKRIYDTLIVNRDQ